MSLQTDSIFIAALQSSPELMEAITTYASKGEEHRSEQPRLYGTAIPMPEEDADNVPLPYLIVTFDGLNNDQTTKDDPYESDYDQVQIGIEAAAPTLEALHTLTQQVREVVHTYFVGHETQVSGYQFRAEPIIYDEWKPGYGQVLRYQCDVELNTEDNG
jgi:hypothetical protein